MFGLRGRWHTFVLAGGVFTPVDLAMASDEKIGVKKLGKPLFVQISDTHIGFNKEANPDVNGTLAQGYNVGGPISPHQRAAQDGVWNSARRGPRSLKRTPF